MSRKGETDGGHKAVRGHICMALYTHEHDENSCFRLTNYTLSNFSLLPPPCLLPSSPLFPLPSFFLSLLPPFFLCYKAPCLLTELWLASEVSDALTGSIILPSLVIQLHSCPLASCKLSNSTKTNSSTLRMRRKGVEKKVRE